MFSKLFRNKEEQTEAFQNFSGMERNKYRYIKLFMIEVEQMHTKNVRSKEEPTGVF